MITIPNLLVNEQDYMVQMVQQYNTGSDNVKLINIVIAEYMIETSWFSHYYHPSNTDIK